MSDRYYSISSASAWCLVVLESCFRTSGARAGKTHVCVVHERRVLVGAAVSVQHSDDGCWEQQGDGVEDVISSSPPTKDWVKQQVDCVFELSKVMCLLLVDGFIIFFCSQWASQDSTNGQVKDGRDNWRRKKNTQTKGNLGLLYCTYRRFVYFWLTVWQFFKLAER